MAIGEKVSINPVSTENDMGNDTMNQVIGNKDDANLSGPGNDSLYGIAAFMAYYHIHNPSLVYPRDDDPVVITAGAGAWTEGTKVEIIANGEKSEAFDIHFVILGAISQNDDYVVKVYTGESGSEVFWGEAAFTRDTNQVRGSQVPIQGPPVASGTRISASLLSGNGSNTTAIKLYTHEYPA